MTRLFCMTSLALACAALLAGFADSLASWGTGEEGLGLGEAAHTLAAQRRRHQRLDSLARATFRCVEGKNRVIQELAAGRLSIEEAVELFGRLEDERDEQLGRAPAERGLEREARLRGTVEGRLQSYREREAARAVGGAELPYLQAVETSPRFAP